MFFNDGNVYSKSLKEDRKLVIDSSLNSGLKELLQDYASFYINNHRAYVSADQVLKHFYLLGLIDELSEKIKIYRSEENVLLISDIIALLNNLVTDQKRTFRF